MAELITVARPYAEAVFRVAKDEQSLAQWGEALAWLSALLSDPAMLGVVTSPETTPALAEKLLADLLGAKGTASVKNLVAALAENRRLVLLPEIANQFEALKKQEEGMLAAEVTSAFPLSDAQATELAETLKSKYGKAVELSVSVDPALIGGVSIQIGDDVIDTSVRGKLQAMAVSLKS